MKVEDIKKILVIGAGTMGHGIAELAAIAGYQVYLSDVSQDILNSAMDKVKWSLTKLKERGTIKEDVETVLQRIRPVVGLDKTVSDADFSIEAITEKIDVKRQTFAKLDELLPPHAILATNTSSLPVSKIAEATKRPDKVVGMHYFNPPALMPLVEVMKGDKTSDETAKVTYELAKKLGKQPIMINKDIPGYVVNRILGGINIASCIVVEKKLASTCFASSKINCSKYMTSSTLPSLTSVTIKGCRSRATASSPAPNLDVTLTIRNLSISLNLSQSALSWVRSIVDGSQKSFLPS